MAKTIKNLIERELIAFWRVFIFIIYRKKFLYRLHFGYKVDSHITTQRNSFFVCVCFWGEFIRNTTKKLRKLRKKCAKSKNFIVDINDGIYNVK